MLLPFGRVLGLISLCSRCSFKLWLFSCAPEQVNLYSSSVLALPNVVCSIRGPGSLPYGVSDSLAIPCVTSVSVTCCSEAVWSVLSSSG